VQIGGGYSLAGPDYNQSKIKGISVYGDLDFKNHFGVEGAIHKVSIWTPSDIGEDTYLLGPRYSFTRGRYSLYGKALFGIGRFQNQGTFATSPHYTSTYGVYAFGGGLDVSLRKHLNLRIVDIEFQKWPGFEPNGLSPIVATFGAAYRF
jgi:hypothetical protein